MIVEIIFMINHQKVWDWIGIEIATPGSAVGLATDCPMGPVDINKSLEFTFGFTRRCDQF